MCTAAACCPSPSFCPPIHTYCVLPILIFLSFVPPILCFLLSPYSILIPVNIFLSPVLPSLLPSSPHPSPSPLPSRSALFVTLAVSRAMCLKVDSKQVVQVHAEAKPGQDLFHVSGEETGDRDKAVWLSPSFHSSPPYLPFHHAFEIRTLT